MGDWPQGQDFNLVTITPAHIESVGTQLTSTGLIAALTAWPAANRAIYVPFIVRSPLTVVKMVVINGTVSGNVDVGIYDSGQNQLVAAGSTVMAGSSTTQTFDVTDTLLQAGVYYFGMAVDNTTATFVAAVPTGAAIPFTQALGVLSQSSAFALPASATFAAAQDAYVPMVALTARTVV